MGLKIWCGRWRKQIAAKHAGLLSTRALARLNRHLADCPECAAAEQWEHVLDKILKQDFTRQAPESFNRGVWQRLQGLPAPWRLRWRWLPSTLTAVAVAAAATAMVVGTYRTLQITQPREYHELAQELTPEADLDEPVIAEMVKDQPKAETTRLPKAAVSEAEAPSDVLLSPEVAPQPELAQAGPVPEREQPQPAFKRFRVPYSRGGLRSAGPVTGEQRAAGAAARAPQDSTYRIQTLSQVRLLRNKIHLNRGERSRLEFVMDSPGRVWAKVFSREGRSVKTILDGELPAGPQSLEWDGTTDSGQKVASGIYVLMVGGDIKERRFKLVVIK